jgi:hypothetical protein
MSISLSWAGGTPHKKIYSLWNRPQSLLLRMVQDLSFNRKWTPMLAESLSNCDVPHPVNSTLLTQLKAQSSPNPIEIITFLTVRISPSVTEKWQRINVYNSTPACHAYYSYPSQNLDGHYFCQLN